MEYSRFLLPRIIEQRTDILAELPDHLLVLALSLISSKSAAEFLRELPDSRSAALLSSMSALDSTDCSKDLTILESRILKILEAESSSELSLGGENDVHEILSQMPGSSRDAVVVAMQQAQPDLAGRIRENFVSFQSILKCDSKSQRILLEWVEPGELALAIRGADPVAVERLSTALPPEKRTAFASARAPIPSPPEEQIRQARDRIVRVCEFLQEELILFIVPDDSDSPQSAARRAELPEPLDFTDLPTLGDAIVRRLLRELRLTDLALALKTMPGVRDVVFRNVSAETLQKLQNKMETLGSVPLYDVEMAQAGIMETLAGLERSSEVTIRKEL